MSKKLISVVMGTYNDGSLLHDTIDSVIAQSHAEIEFIIINDGSTDLLTAQILADYAGRDERICILNKENEGLTKALIDGCECANGEYIARIDVGDTMASCRLKKQLEILNHIETVNLVSSWTSFYSPCWEYLYTENPSFSYPEGVSIIPQNEGTNVPFGPTAHTSVMFKKSQYEKVGGYHWQFYYGQDWDLWYRLAEVGHFYLIEEVLTKQRIFPSGLSSRNRLRQELLGNLSLKAFWARLLEQDEDRFLTQAAEIRPGNPRCPQESAKPGEGNYFLASTLYKNQNKKAKAYYYQAWKEAPLNPKYAFSFFRGMIF
ncbi:MAG: glycosyltransferase [Lentisphaeria bacterium]|nr:glycosyltransferase [Lentisphaeria bacterium]